MPHWSYKLVAEVAFDADIPAYHGSDLVMLSCIHEVHLPKTCLNVIAGYTDQRYIDKGELLGGAD